MTSVNSIRKVILLLLLFLLFQVVPAQAHSELEKTYPQSGQVLEEFPIQIELLAITMRSLSITR